MRSPFCPFLSTGRPGRARRVDRSVGAGTHRRPRWIGGREIAVQDLRIETQPVGPNDAAGLGIDSHLLEELRISEWLEHLAPKITRQVDSSIRAVAEYQTQPEVGEGVRLGDAGHHLISLRQRINWIQGRLAPQVVAPIHPDDDPVDLRDPRHGSAQPCARGFLALRGLGPGGPTRRAASSNASRSTYVSLSRGRLYVRSNPRSIQRQMADRERPMILAASTVVTSRSSGGRGTAGGYGIAGLECHNPPSTIIAITGLESYNRSNRKDRRTKPGSSRRSPESNPLRRRIRHEGYCV